MKEKNFKRGIWLGSCLALVLLNGCAAEPTSAPPASIGAEAPQTSESNASAEESSETKAATRTQAETCDWETPATTHGPQEPTGQNGELQDVIIGSWQHTHYDEGNGYTAFADEDIRFVFSSADRMLYCQHIAGITDHAENATDITWDGTRIVLPGGAPGFEVLAWNDQTMIWINRMDNSHYLLQRR